jgi:hypothetical protein
MAYWLNNRNSIPGKARNLSPLYSVQKGSEAQLESCSTGTEALSSGVKRLGREAQHSPPSSAEVMNGEAIITPSWRGA